MANPVCGTDCSQDLLEVSFNECAPEVNLSEIVRIYMGKSIGAAFADWTQATEWTTRLSQSSSVGDDYIRTLTVIGDKPAPSSNSKEISGGRTIRLNKSHVLNITIDETNDLNHEFLRSLECGGKVRFWYETLSGHLFGGNEGIEADAIMDMVLNRGQEEYMTFAGTLSWKSKFTEERCESPIA